MQHDTVVRKLKAMTDGPTPLFHRVSVDNGVIAVQVQPWGSPMFLTWSQAETFAKELPLQMPPAKKAVASERGRMHGRVRRHA